MKWVFLTVASGKELWFEEAKKNWCDKISRLMPFEFEEIKSIKLEREESVLKTKKETELLISRIHVDDIVLLFDERGKTYDSIGWAHSLEKEITYSQKKRMVFIIGGAFGVEEALRKRAHKVVSLSGFVMNHRVATLVALEQMYRSLTIIKKIPYHNS